MGDGIELEYYNSDDYRLAVERIAIREKNPIRVYFIKNNDQSVGFAMYQILFDEEKASCLMECFIESEHRGHGLGQVVYSLIEKVMTNDGVEIIELTPTNAMNERFWVKQGFTKTDELDEDNKYIYKKMIKAGE